jgi:hypothetical protein
MNGSAPGRPRGPRWDRESMGESQVMPKIAAERRTGTLRPIAFTTLVAVISLGLLAAAVGFGWLGLDVDRGADFCERSGGLVPQPVNTLSNLGFVVAGLAVAVQTGRPGGLGAGSLDRWPVVALTYASIVVLLGPGSMAMHATETAAGGWLDMTSMFLIAAFVVAYAAMRCFRRGPRFLAAVFIAALAGCELVVMVDKPVPVIMSTGNLAFGGCLAAGVLLERQVARRGDAALDRRWLWAVLGILAAACGVWMTAKSGSALCFPHSLYQGHAVWHLLCALAAWLLFQFYVSEHPVPPATRRSSGHA